MTCKQCAENVVERAMVARYLAPSEMAQVSRNAAPDGLGKFQRYRAARRAGGMKLLRVWVPDPAAPGFQEKARRQATLLRDAPEEIEALALIEAAGDWNDGAA